MLEGEPPALVQVVRSALGTQERLTQSADLVLVPDFALDGFPTIDVDVNLVDQEIVGFGGAFTEAAAVTFAKLNPELQEMLVEQYWGSTGIGYTLGRIHINSCDFSVQSYSFDDVPGDFSLQHFDHSLAHDKEALIPLVLRATEKVNERAAAEDVVVTAAGKTVGEFEQFMFHEGITDKEDVIALQAKSAGKFFSVGPQGEVKANAVDPGPSTHFRVITNEDGRISLKAVNGKYLLVSNGGLLSASGVEASPDCTFAKAAAPGGTYSLQSSKGGFVSADLGRKLRMLASPWSPPAWMKTTDKMTSSGRVCLKNGAHHAWAEYISTWIADIGAAGVPIWGLTVQNEPTNPAGWEACTMNPGEESDFVAEHLGPVVKSQHPEVSIFVFDDSKHMLPDYVNAAMSKPETAKYVDGAAFHWYSGDFFDKVSWVHKDHPELMLLPSEATYERRMWKQGMVEAYSDWRFGEGYAHDIIGDLNNGAVGWIDWNLLLEKTGGPNHVGNVCDAAVVADCKEQMLDVHPQYYFIGHFSKFILPGSRHVASTIKGAKGKYAASQAPGPYGICTGAGGLETTAARRPDGQTAVVVLNCAEEDVMFKLRSGGTAVKASAPRRSITTFVLPALVD